MRGLLLGNGSPFAYAFAICRLTVQRRQTRRRAVLKLIADEFSGDVPVRLSAVTASPARDLTSALFAA